MGNFFLAVTSGTFRLLSTFKVIHGDVYLSTVFIPPPTIPTRYSHILAARLSLCSFVSARVPIHLSLIAIYRFGSLLEKFSNKNRNAQTVRDIRQISIKNTKKKQRKCLHPAWNNSPTICFWHKRSRR